jgi:hypothetical protein
MTGFWAVLFQLAFVVGIALVSALSIRSLFRNRRRPWLVVQAVLLTAFAVFMVSRYVLYVRAIAGLHSLREGDVARIFRNGVEVAEPEVKQAMVANLSRCRPFQRTSSLKPDGSITLDLRDGARLQWVVAKDAATGKSVVYFFSGVGVSLGEVVCDELSGSQR